MNLLLFDSSELGRPLAREDRRAVHLLEVLRRGEGDLFDAGVLDGPRGKATLTRVSAEGLEFSFTPQVAVSGPSGLNLVLGLPRPQTARDVLRDATTLGVDSIDFVVTEKTEPGYVRSKLWTSGEWRRHLIAGAEQAFDTRLPAISWARPLADVVAGLATADVRIALDNYEAPASLGGCPLAARQRVVLAIGGERGWSASERALFRTHGFQFFQLGTRVLRTETACIAALSILRTKLALM